MATQAQFNEIIQAMNLKIEEIGLDVVYQKEQIQELIDTINENGLTGLEEDQVLDLLGDQLEILTGIADVVTIPTDEPTEDEPTEETPVEG